MGIPGGPGVLLLFLAALALRHPRISNIPAAPGRISQCESKEVQVCFPTALSSISPWASKEIQHPCSLRQN